MHSVWTCVRQKMDRYEEFCLQSMSMLQEEGEFKKTCEPLTRTYSVILFHGKAVLSPLLNDEQRHEMCNYRRMAVQLEADQRNPQKNKLPIQDQDILTSCNVQSVEPESKETQDGNKPACKVQHLRKDEVQKSSVSKSAAVSGYTLITDSPGLPKVPGIGTVLQPISPVAPIGLIANDNVKVDTEDKSDEEDMSMDSLLKQTKDEHVRKDQSRDGSKGLLPTSEAITEIKSPKSGVEFGFSLHHSPLGPPQTFIHQTVYDLPQSALPCIPDRCIRRPSPESSCRRKPRPFSTGNIHISFLGMPGEGSELSDWEEAPSPDHWSSVGGERFPNRKGSRQSTVCTNSPVWETHSSMSPSGPNLFGQPEHLSSTFRRRSHTMDSQLGTNQPDYIDRSQERTPRFMAGVVTVCPTSRQNSVAPLNKSYKIESPTSYLRRVHVTPELAQGKHWTHPSDPRGPRDVVTSPTFLRHAANANNTEVETQRRAEALEDIKKRLEEEHALQMSVLLAEQEKEQQRLRLDLEEAERRLREQESVHPQNCATWNGLLAGISPTNASAERSPGHSIGFPSPISSDFTPPSLQSPVYIRGPIWAASKLHARESQVLTTEQQRALCRIGAIARGFLIRRLLKTHKIKYLRQTIMDTKAFISSFQTEGPPKKVSEQDLCLQERVQAQLRAALYDINEIFFEMPLKDRLALLQQDRELCVEKKLRDMDKAKSHKEKVILSAATQRSMDRKKREGESPGQGRKVMQKPKSPTPNRSWYKKTPETRVKRMDNVKNLKKQHSLG
ncbi:uncharacterized protein LOC133642177 isoform X2 [Entelurus aequoreus]|uniref:uncharacterized protein LOC133642177 isoform X2 n=1 Tax=Entelurus aequoreus TaxID=161455 RepID=UPI002B1DACCD|nr:uncharacterized protein LOC133642177 isoform X2 [Entelurus aequoreus]